MSTFEREQHKMRVLALASRLLTIAVLSGGIASAVFLAPGCVDKNPIVTGHRDAGTDARVQINTVVPLADDPDVDAPDCRHCGETLSTETARGTLCRHNGTDGQLSSVRRLNALVECLCYDKCVQECGTYCAGAANTSGCQVCIINNCIDRLNDCNADAKP